jgi:hypothetical protein
MRRAYEPGALGPIAGAIAASIVATLLGVLFSGVHP